MNGKTIAVSTDYTPRPLQAYLHQRMKRFNVLILHRRAGKTVLAVNEMLDRGLRSVRKNPQIAYIGTTYGAAKRVAWDYVKQSVKQIPGVEINESELRVDIPRGDDRVRIILLGAENPNSLRGMYLDFVVLDEYASFDPEIWTSVLRPALSDRLGGALFITTPLGANHAADLYRRARRDDSGEWFAALFKASETKIIPQRELEAARSFMSAEQYEQEYECSFTAALVGAYYKEEMRAVQDSKRIGVVPYDTHAPVMTGFDLGIDDSTAIWYVQQTGRELHAIDYTEVSGKGLAWIAKEMLAKPYIYGRHFLPHDAQARELGTGTTRVETLKALGLKNIEIVKRQKVEDGINAVRGTLGKMWFDEGKCGYGIESLKSYERSFDSKEGVYSLKPKHNWASHGADAMRTFAVGFRGEEHTLKSDDYPDKADSEYDPLTW